MGYLFICLAALAGVTKGFCGKKTSGIVTETREVMLVNAIRMMLCAVIGVGIVFAAGSLSQLRIDNRILWIAVMSGVSSALFVVLWLITVRNSTYMMLDVFLMSGTVIPIAASVFLFGEAITINQITGLAILVFAMYTMCSYNSKIKGKMTVCAFVNLILCGVMNGIADFSQKIFVMSNSTVSNAVFNFYTYVFAAIFLILCYGGLSFRKDGSGKNEGAFKNKSVFIYICIMSACLFLHSYFKIIAAKYLTAAEVYPLSQGLAIIVSAVMSVVLLKEKMTVKSVVGILLAFVGLLFINVL